MNDAELFHHLTDEVPRPVPVIPVAFLDDPRLPPGFVPVEPAAFALACAQAAWGRRGPRN